eukprot:COSAG01_NODE_2733_length_7167_cov_48.846067_3_plen_161_part_00
MQADDAAHAPAADLAGVIDNLITDARQKEDQRDAALARVAYLEKLVEKMTPIYQQAMIKNIHDKWMEGATWFLGEEETLQFTRFLDGDSDNFDATNTVWVTPYEWFTAEDGGRWCVPFAQGGEIGLSGDEQAFVLNNFALLASHFAGLKRRYGGPLPNQV